jgi:bifunctional DNA-binding transcriptional regulator/antitoxin component of YhaV-PrlF toxin-antitoxin module
MTILTVTSRGQVTFRKEILKHLRIQPGDTIQLNLLPDGRAQIQATRPKGSFKQLHGFLKGKTNGAMLSIEEINDAIANAGAKAGESKK